MNVLRWLDRAWTAVVGLSFVCLALLWFLLSVERMGVQFVVGAIVMALLLRWSAVPVAPSPPQTPDE